MSKFILTDVDQTVLHFADYFEEWVRARRACPDERLGVKWSIESWLNIDHDEATRLVQEFSSDLGIMSCLRPEDHAVEGVQALARQGWEFVAITACYDTEGIWQARWHNLHEVFGPVWRHLHITGLQGSKEQYLRSYDPTIWVEDSIEHALVGAELGHRTFLIDHPYNQGDHPNITRVKDWREIARVLTDG